MANTNDIKNNTILNFNGDLWNVLEFQHVKPGKGGAFVRTKIKNILSGKIIEKTFNAGAKIDFAIVDRQEYTYLYKDEKNYIFMDLTTYDQIMLTDLIVGDAANFLIENQNVYISFYNEKPLYIELPPNVILKIKHTEPWLQGNRSNIGTKPAKLETGFEIQVPIFINNEEKIKIDTRNGEYLGRIKE